MKTYHIITIGCQMNKSDSERIAGYLEERGFVWSEDKNGSDLVVITTCGVRQSAEDRVYGFVNAIKRKNPKTKMILTGCLADRKDVKKRLKDKVDIWLPITELKGLAEKLGIQENNESSLKGYLNILPKYNSRFSAFVPIGNGCDNFCTYCVVPYARGRETYRNAEEIIKEVKDLIKNGYKEITLIAQNVNSYKSGNIKFPDLLRMVNAIKGDFWLRFSTSHPKDMSDDLIGAMAECDKLCEHIHLPVQAGDDEILRRMNRNYTRKHYLGLIKKIIGIWPRASVTTDIIVGFPGETWWQFNKTARLFKKVKFDMAYISQYSPRPGTVSAKMKDNVSRQGKKRREEKLMKILRKTSLSNNKKYRGEVVDVLVDGKTKEGEWYGKTRTSKVVRIRKDNKRCQIGEFFKVKIDEVEDFGLRGNLV